MVVDWKWKYKQTYALEGSCPGEQYFHPQTFIIDTTFCGDWAGQVFGPPGGPYGLYVSSVFLAFLLVQLKTQNLSES